MRAIDTVWIQYRAYMELATKPLKLRTWLKHVVRKRKELDELERQAALAVYMMPLKEWRRFRKMIDRKRVALEKLEGKQ